MNPNALVGDLASQIPPELLTLGLAVTALSGSFYFVWGIVGPPLRALKNTIFNLMYREIEVHISNPDYAKFNLWLNANAKYTHFQRSFSVVNGRVLDENGGWNSVGDFDDDDEGNSPSRLVAGYGTVVIKAPGLPIVVVKRQKVEASQVFKQTELMTFRLFSLTSTSINEFFNQVTNVKGAPGPFVYTGRHSYWDEIGKPKNVMPPLGSGAEEFINLIQQFRDSKEEYTRRGLAYKMGILMYGSPGTGKTSIVAYAAHYFGMHIYKLNSETIAKFDELRSDVKRNSIILIDDIDMTIAGSGRAGLLKKNASIATEIQKPAADDDSYMKIINNDTMREFLNALDGICEFDGSIIVANTNKPEVLDDALIRPGRLDHKIEIGPFSHNEQIQHINRFFGTTYDPDDFIGIEDRTFAEIQLLCETHMRAGVDEVIKRL